MRGCETLSNVSTTNGHIEEGEEVCYLRALLLFRGGLGDTTRMGYIGGAEVHYLPTLLGRADREAIHALKLDLGSRYVVTSRGKYVYMSAPDLEGRIEALRRSLEASGAIRRCVFALYSESCYLELKQWSTEENLELYSFVHNKATFYVVQVPAAE
jgi:hypothetical protein